MLILGLGVQYPLQKNVIYHKGALYCIVDTGKSDALCLDTACDVTVVR